MAGVTLITILGTDRLTDSRAAINSNFTACASISASLTATYVPVAGAGGVLGDSSMIVDANGNVGFGATPPAFGASLGYLGSIAYGYGGQATSMVAGNASFWAHCLNAYVPVSGVWTYVATGVATQYQQITGKHTFAVAPSGTAGNPITWTTGLLIDNSGSVGLNGATPPAFISTWPGVSFLSGHIQSGGGTMSYQQNAYLTTGTVWKYQATAAASIYQQNAGQHVFYVAGSGTAGNTITWTQAMTIINTGKVGIGINSPAAQLDVAGTIRATGATTPASGAGLEFLYSGGNTFIQAYNRTGAAWLPLMIQGSGVVIAAPAAQGVVDGTMPSGSIQFYLDESGNNLKVRVKYSNGTTLKTGTLALV